jgi:hypothetical protein
VTSLRAGASTAWDRAVKSVRAATLRAELALSEIPAPTGLAPFAIAFAGDVAPHPHTADPEYGTGRFVLLYDPSSPAAWSGPWRVICFAQAPLEVEIGVDPFLADVTWSWLLDALDSRGAQYIAASGTATKILSTGFGELEEQGDGAQVELRASWSPVGGELSSHLEGWGDVLCLLAGLPPVEGVSSLAAHRAARD